MLKNFINSNNTEEEDDMLLSSFFKEKQKREFIENWKHKINSGDNMERDINVTKQPAGKIIKLRNLLLSRASIVIIFFFITISLVYIFKGPDNKYKYEYSIKGNGNYQKQINDLVNEISSSIFLSSEENPDLLKLFMASDFDLAKQTAERMILNENSNDYYKKIAIMSAIKLNQYIDSYKMFKKYYLSQNIQIPDDLKQLFELNKKMLKIRN